MINVYLLLAGGGKDTQESDVKIARKIWDQYGSMGLQAHASCAWAGFGPRPSFRPERYPALQGGVGAVSGLKAGVSDHKGTEDKVNNYPMQFFLSKSG